MEIMITDGTLNYLRYHRNLNVGHLAIFFLYVGGTIIQSFMH